MSSYGARVRVATSVPCSNRDFSAIFALLAEENRRHLKWSRGAPPVGDIVNVKLEGPSIDALAAHLRRKRDE